MRKLRKIQLGKALSYLHFAGKSVLMLQIIIFFRDCFLFLPLKLSWRQYSRLTRTGTEPRLSMLSSSSSPSLLQVGVALTTGGFFLTSEYSYLTAKYVKASVFSSFVWTIINFTIGEGHFKLECLFSDWGRRSFSRFAFTFGVYHSLHAPSYKVLFKYSVLISIVWGL